MSIHEKKLQRGKSLGKKAREIAIIDKFLMILQVIGPAAASAFKLSGSTHTRHYESLTCEITAQKRHNLPKIQYLRNRNDFPGIMPNIHQKHCENFFDDSH